MHAHTHKKNKRRRRRRDIRGGEGIIWFWVQEIGANFLMIILKHITWVSHKSKREWLMMIWELISVINICINTTSSYTAIYKRLSSDGGGGGDSILRKSKGKRKKSSLFNFLKLTIYFVPHHISYIYIKKWKLLLLTINLILKSIKKPTSINQ